MPDRDFNIAGPDAANHAGPATDPVDVGISVDADDVEHADHCPVCSTDIDRPELDWLWQVPARQLLRLLEGAGPIAAATMDGQLAPYDIELRSLGMYLIIDTPYGPPVCASEFLTRCIPIELATVWGGSIEGPWTGPRGVDIEIAAVNEQHMFPRLVAEFSNLFRDWATHPEHARRCAASAHIPIEDHTY